MSNNWIINNDESAVMDEEHRQYRKGYESGFRVRVCEHCGKVYEFDHYNKVTIYHEDFPRYGLAKKICRNCG